MKEGGLMNIAGKEGIWAGRGKVWLRETAVFICPLLRLKKQLTADGTVCGADIQSSQYIRGLLPCAILSQVYRCCVCGVISNTTAADINNQRLISTCAGISPLLTCCVMLNGALAKSQLKIFFSYITSHDFIPLQANFFPHYSITSAFPHKVLMSPYVVNVLVACIPRVDPSLDAVL